MNLIDTVEIMNSSDYKERFKAEYYQLKIRVAGLEKMLNNYLAGALSFKPTCPYNLLHSQLVFMQSYKKCLEERAEIEKIDLGDNYGI